MRERERWGGAVRQASLCILAVICWIGVWGPTQTLGYDPLVKKGGTRAGPSDFLVNDTGRQRQIPILVYLPSGTNAAPVVLFSHGLGGNRQGGRYLGEHWAERDYAAVFLQHPGSDDSVWKGKAAGTRAALADAASGRNFLLRAKDVGAVLDRLETWNSAKDHALFGRLDLAQVGMSGHSFGAVTTQAVSGQALPGTGALFTDTRIRAAIAFSPSGPRRGAAETAFGKVKIPWMLMTGTRDTAQIGNIDLPSRLSVFPALPPGGKYELVLHDAEHSAFTDRALPGDTVPRNPNHHRAILALSTAFWDAHLKGDAAALAWLRGDGPRSLLEEKDRWQLK